MKIHAKGLPFALAALLALLLVVPSCGDQDDPVNPEDRLCGGESGFAALVKGRANPVEVCTSNDDAIMTFSGATGNYSIQATMQMGDILFQFNLEVPHHDQTPQILTLTHDAAAASGDRFAVWIYYQELPNSGEDLESYEVSGGSLTLSYSDTSVLTATFEDITLKMRTISTPHEDRGTRVVERGFMSLSVNS
jgi:hypothetical protein